MGKHIHTYTYTNIDAHTDTRTHTNTDTHTLDWINDPERVSSTDQLRLNLISHWGESTECGITKLGVRSGSQLLTRAID